MESGIDNKGYQGSSLSAPRSSGADRKISFVAVSNLQIPGQNSRKSSKSENSHTYVYEPEDYADQHQLTVDALPSVEAYDRDGYRPTLDDILEGKSGVKQDQDVEEGEVKEGKVIKFGWVEGVLMRCLLNIWGTMLFLRLTWVVGQAGIWQGLMIISLCNVVTILSALSMSAIATNGQIAAGGVYYMISRALGPALGGSIGLMFTVANTISVATYTIGFSESLLDFLQDVIPGWNGIVTTLEECAVAGCRPNDVRIVGAPVLCIFLFIAFAGMDWVTRIQKSLLVLLMFAQLDMFLGSVLDLESVGSLYLVRIDTEKTDLSDNYGNTSLKHDSQGYMQIDYEQRHAFGFTGWSLDTANDNFNPQYETSPMQEDPQFIDLFGVFFTAVTGIVAGANLSGDLKDPAQAIPTGTLLAIGLTYVTYMFFGLTAGFVFLPKTSGIREEFEVNQPDFDIKKWETNYKTYENRTLESLLNCTYRDHVITSCQLPMIEACDDNWVENWKIFEKIPENIDELDDDSDNERKTHCCYGYAQDKQTLDDPTNIDEKKVCNWYNMDIFNEGNWTGIDDSTKDLFNVPGKTGFKCKWYKEAKLQLQQSKIEKFQDYEVPHITNNQLRSALVGLDGLLDPDTNLPWYDSGRQWPKNAKCSYGSAQDQMTMTYISFTGYLRYAGGFSASLSSAIASLVGAPRVLQAVGVDKLYPGVHWFSYGANANNDPYRGYILVFVVAFALAMVASLNAVGIIASNFFLAAYALMNLSCFHSAITKSPGWRPAFKYYNPWVCLFSSALCVGIMFWMSWIYATATIGVLVILGLYVFWANPEANWGSSTQGQVFVSALKHVKEVTETPEHVKNYRPKILLMTGNPAHRPPLVNFGQLITKNTSLLLCGHVLDDPRPVNIDSLKNNVQLWLKDHKVGGFYSVVQHHDFETGTKALMSIAGVGKMSPNMVMLGFKKDWRTDMDGLEKYMNTLYNAFDMNLSVGILRVKKGLDYSHLVASEKIIQKANSRKVSIFHGKDGHVLEASHVAGIQQFLAKKHVGYIDVWWLFDDGGLTLLIPYILTMRKQYHDCALRIFTLAKDADKAAEEKANMETLLAKFRIEFEEVIIISDIGKKADTSTQMEFDEIIEGMNVSEEELHLEQAKTNRHLRLAEMVRNYSSESEMVVMTLPLPKRGATSPALYMSWLDVMTKDMPPVLFVRGNQQSVLTFYS